MTIDPPAGAGRRTNEALGERDDILSMLIQAHHEDGGHGGEGSHKGRPGHHGCVQVSVSLSSLSFTVTF